MNKTDVKAALEKQLNLLSYRSENADNRELYELTFAMVSVAKLLAAQLKLDENTTPPLSTIIEESRYIIGRDAKGEPIYG